MWKLYDDSTGKVLRKAHGEPEIKIAYTMAIDSGEVLEVNAYISPDDGDTQFAYNKHTGQWDEL